MTDTPLDKAHAAMAEAPDDDAARLTFFERLADNELFLLLDSPAKDDVVSPLIFDTVDGRFALVFDREWRLSEFTGQSAPFAALTGRTIAALLAGQEIGLGVNLDVAPSSTLVPADALEWLAETLSNAPKEESARPTELRPPQGIPEKLLVSIDTKLSGAVGLADVAFLNLVKWENGQRGHLLSFVGPAPGADKALANAVSEALIFSGIDAGVLDVAFFGRDDSIVAKLTSTGLRFDLPQYDQPTRQTSPGMDPTKPPRLV